MFLKYLIVILSRHQIDDLSIINIEQSVIFFMKMTKIMN
jgi:hypothetical protein